jgi:hypothetical protein
MVPQQTQADRDDPRPSTVDETVPETLDETLDGTVAETLDEAAPDAPADDTHARKNGVTGKDPSTADAIDGNAQTVPEITAADADADGDTVDPREAPDRATSTGPASVPDSADDVSVGTVSVDVPPEASSYDAREGEATTYEAASHDGRTYGAEADAKGEASPVMAVDTTSGYAAPSFEATAVTDESDAARDEGQNARAEEHIPATATGATESTADAAVGSPNEVTNDEVVNDEVVNDEVVNNEVMNDEVVKNEVVNNEVVNGEAVNETVRDDEPVTDAARDNVTRDLDAEQADATPYRTSADRDTVDGQAFGAAVEVTQLSPGDVEVAPVAELWPAASAEGLRERWRDLQLRFVDDPHGAATEADSLVGEVVETLTAALATQRADLSSWRSAGNGDTEQLRVAVQRYREFLDRVLGL